jgi:hypothetical protein
MWGKAGEMAMQFVHFSYAMGGVVGPLATEPFLTPVSQTPEVYGPGYNATDQELMYAVNSSVLVGSNLSMYVNVTDTAELQVLPETTIVYYAYIISGSNLLVISMAWMVEVYIDRFHKRRRLAQDRCARHQQPLSGVIFFLVTGMLVFLFCLLRP